MGWSEKGINLSCVHRRHRKKKKSFGEKTHQTKPEIVQSAPKLPPRPPFESSSEADLIATVLLLAHTFKEARQRKEKKT